MPWRDAMQQALYGRAGFFTRHAPRDHFRTSACTSPLFAQAIARLAGSVDQAMGDGRFEIVDIGAGRGELLLGIAVNLASDLRKRARFRAVELAPRPEDLPQWIDWLAEPPRHVTGLLVATEWLDNVPLEVVERGEAGEWRQVLVDPATGAEEMGGPVAPEDAAWLRRWWAEGVRAEPGGPRDAAWAAAVSTLDRGLAVAVDYGHLAAARPMGGTLTGYRDGRQVAPVPDGSCDLTAHVAVDAVATAGERAAGRPSQLLDQRAALRALGVDATRPPLSLASEDPGGYVRALAAATQAAELTDPYGLGAHYWLTQPVDISVRLEG